MMSGLSTTNDLPNVAAYGPDWCQLGFVQGATGALVSTSGIIGGVGAIEIFPAQLTIEGLNLGAETAKSGRQSPTHQRSLGWKNSVGSHSAWEGP